VVALVRARALSGFDTCVRTLGGDPTSLLSVVGLHAGDMQDPQRWISFKAYLRALELASRTLGEPGFGVKMHRARDFSYLGPLLIVAQHSETLTSALRNISRYLSIQNTGYRTAFAVGPDSCVRSYEMASDLRRIGDQFIEESLMSTWKLISTLTGESVPVIRFAMRHRPLRAYDAYLADYGAPVLFEQEFDGVVIERRFAEQPIPNRDENIQRFVLDYLDERILPSSGEVVSATRNLIEALIPMGQASIETISEHLTMHPRTLQRRLKDSGWSFSRVLEEQRKAMAERMLKDGNLPLSHVASYLGYAEQSAFNHAFERWHGISPTRWKRQAD
jgi:AraC-like DNA-binding protein